MSLIQCPACGNTISAAAPQCVRCGHPIAQQFNAPATANKPNNGYGTAALLIVGLIGASGAWFALKSSQSTNTQREDSVYQQSARSVNPPQNAVQLAANVIQEAVAVVRAPWPERARSAVGPYLSREGDALASRLLPITHPTGNAARIGNYSSSLVADQLVTRFDLMWNGGVIGTQYVTTIEWRCSESGHVSAQVVADTAWIGVSGNNRVNIENLFREEVSPAFHRLVQ